MDFLLVFLLAALRISLSYAALDITSGSIEGYFTPEEVLGYLNSTVGDSVELVTIGNTYLEKDIFALHLNSKKDIKVLVVAAHHARELISVTQVLYIIDELLTASDPSLVHLRETAEFWFVPILNLDSYDEIAHYYKEHKTIMPIRKNMRENSCVGFGVGVDINRNYGYKWGYDNLGSSDQKCEEDYRGKSPFSEPETQAIRNLFSSNNFTLAVSYHSWGNLYVHPFGYINSQDVSMYKFPEDLEFYKSLWDVIPRNSEVGTPYDLLDYPANGAFVDYAYNEGAISLTIELGEEFHPPMNLIKELVTTHGKTFFNILERVLPDLNINIGYAELSDGLLSVSYKLENRGLYPTEESSATFRVSNNFTLESLSFKDRDGSSIFPPLEYKDNELEFTIPGMNRLEVQELNLLLSIEDYPVSTVKFYLQLASNQTYEGSAKLSRSLPDLETEEDNDSDSGVNKDAAIGITIALIILIIGIIFIVKFYRRRKQASSPPFQGFEPAGEPRVIAIPGLRNQELSPNQIILQEKKEVFTID